MISMTGAARPRCAFGIVMGRTGSANTRAHKSHSMIIVPFDTPGVKRVRDLTVFGYNGSYFQYIAIAPALKSD